MAVRPGAHNEAWKLVTNTGAVLETFNNGGDAIRAARQLNRQTWRDRVRIPVQAVRA